MDENKYQAIIGLEIHVELKTTSKVFCGCLASWFGKKPNTLCCPVCLGLPGALPVPSKRAIEWCLMLGLALNCQIPEFSKFDRKNYFYPDLPKGYQISQYDKPFAINGWLKLKTEREKTIRIRRVHLEEDTGKLIHAKVNGENCTLIDFNRSGVPLVEIVTEPDIRNNLEAVIFLKKLRQIIRYLGISDADMEKGSMRIEPNISIKIPNSKFQIPNYKVEVKNVNSFNFAKKAIDYEIKRQIKLLKKGETPTQETRGWDEKKGVTYSQRIKEEAHDYRYFPEPDIPPIRITKSQISNLKSQIPELPDEKLIRFMKDYGLSEYNALLLTEEKGVADYFEETAKLGVKNYGSGVYKTIANLIINKKIDYQKVSPGNLLELISRKQVALSIDERRLKVIIEKIIKQNSKAIDDYKSGKEQALMFLIGQIMRESRGRGDPQKVKKILKERLEK